MVPQTLEKTLGYKQFASFKFRSRHPRNQIHWQYPARYPEPQQGGPKRRWLKSSWRQVDDHPLMLLHSWCLLETPWIKTQHPGQQLLETLGKTSSIKATNCWVEAPCSNHASRVRLCPGGEVEETVHPWDHIWFCPDTTTDTLLHVEKPELHPRKNKTKQASDNTQPYSAHRWLQGVRKPDLKSGHSSACLSRKRTCLH